MKSTSSEKIERIIKKALEKKEKLFEKNKNIDFISYNDPKKFKIVEKFLKKKKLKLFGGNAINFYVGKEDKFYAKNELPDYDVYSPTPWTDAIELADLLHSEGYIYTEVRSGIHPGTFKVYSNLWQIADITYMEKNYYNKIPTNVINGLNVCDPVYLQLSMYKEFQEPYRNPARWTKVSKRQKLLEKWNPIFVGDVKSCNKQKDHKCENVYRGTALEKIFNKLNTYIEKQKLIRIGDCAYNKYLSFAEMECYCVKISNYEVLSCNIEKNVKDLMKMYDFRVEKVFSPYIDLFKNSYEFYLDDILFLKIYKTENCIPYKVFGRSKNYYGTIDMMKYTLLSQYIFLDDKKEYEEKYIILNFAQKEYYKKNHLTEYDESPFQRFIVSCKGNDYNVVKRTLFERSMKKKVEEEKVKLKKDDCVYPYYWDEKKDLCFSIPLGIYKSHLKKIEY